MANSSFARCVGVYSMVGSFLALAACAGQSITLIDPQSGATAHCSASGFAIGMSVADGIIGGCSRVYETRGYVPLDRLQPDERASLERRGLLPEDK